MREEFKKLIEIPNTALTACLKEVPFQPTKTTKSNITVDCKLKYFRPGPNNTPKQEVLSDILSDYLVEYALSRKDRAGVSGQDFKTARNRLKLFDITGEPGEILLFFLIEVVLKAPQLICKVALKTNRSDEIKGIDAIHGNWNTQADCLHLFMGESKIHSQYSNAISDCYTSLETLNQYSKLKDELWLTSLHFKHAEEKVQTRLTEILNQKTSTETYKLSHVCLIGYDENKYKTFTAEKMAADIEKEFEEHFLGLSSDRYEKIIEKVEGLNISSFGLTFFLVPFVDVEDFRKKFLKHLTTG